MLFTDSRFGGTIALILDTATFVISRQFGSVTVIEESQQGRGDHYEGQIRQPELTAVLHGCWMFPCGSMIKIQIEFRRGIRRLIGIVSLVARYTG